MSQGPTTFLASRGCTIPPSRSSPFRSLHRIGLVSAARIASILPVLLVSVFISASSPGPAMAHVWHVPGQIGDIQIALDFAAAGDTVSVAAGAYTIHNTIAMHKERQTLMADVPQQAALIGETYDVLIRIDASLCSLIGLYLFQSVGPLVRVSAVDVTVADGTIRGGGWSDGIEIYGTDTIVRNNEFLNSGIYEIAQAAVIEGNRFSGIGGVFTTADCTIHGNVFDACISGDDTGHSGNGAAIHASGVGRTLVIDGNVFEDCVTIQYISDPNSPPSGGAVYLDGCADAQVTHNRFLRNQATRGGGLYAHSSLVRIEGNLFHANTDSSYVPENPGRGRGGAIYLDNCPGTVKENTIARNVAMIDGGAILATGSLSPLTENNIFYRNRSAGAAVSCEAQASAVIRCSDAFGNSGADYGGICSNAGGENDNFSADPLFCDEHAADPDCTLHRDSPCLPDHSPDGCGLVGAYGVGPCSPAGVENETAGETAWSLRIQPNPSRGAVAISLRGPSAGAVAIEIYDAGGRRIHTARGASMTWDGRDGNGRAAANGVYFARATRSDGRVIARAAIVLAR